MGVLLGAKARTNIPVRAPILHASPGVGKIVLFYLVLYRHGRRIGGFLHSLGRVG